MVSGCRFSFPRKEEDSCSVVVEVSEPSGGGLDRLNAAVEAFRGAIADVVTKPRQDIRQVLLEHLGNFFHRLQTTTDRPGVPTNFCALPVPDVA